MKNSQRKEMLAKYQKLQKMQKQLDSASKSNKLDRLQSALDKQVEIARISRSRKYNADWEVVAVNVNRLVSKMGNELWNNQTNIPHLQKCSKESAEQLKELLPKIRRWI